HVRQKSDQNQQEHRKSGKGSAAGASTPNRRPMRASRLLVSRLWLRVSHSAARIRSPITTFPRLVRREACHGNGWGNRTGSTRPNNDGSTSELRKGDLFLVE